MYTLHIEHPITDFAQWSAAFARFASLRHAAGVRSYAVRRPLDDAHHISVDLDFDEADQAAAFLETLRTRVWSDPSSSPALAGAPVTRIFAVEDLSARTLHPGSPVLDVRG